MYGCMSGCMSWISSKGWPHTRPKMVPMDIVFRGERHRPVLVGFRHTPCPGSMLLLDPSCVAFGKRRNFEASHWEKIRESAGDRDLKWRQFWILKQRGSWTLSMDFVGLLADEKLAQLPREPMVNVISHDIKLEVHTGVNGDWKSLHQTVVSSEYTMHANSKPSRD